MKKQKEVAAIEDDEQKFVVANGKVSWKFRRGVIELTLDALDEIFFQYSKHGLNMSQVQVQNKHGLTAIEWQSFKRTFDLVKDSDVFSPYTLSLHSDKEACDMIASRIAEKYSPKNMRAVVEYEAGKQTRKAYDKAIKDAERLNFKRQEFENALADYITESKVAPLVRRSKDVRAKHAIVHVCDLHIGAEIEAERNLPAFNADVVAKKLAEIAKDANSRKAEKATVVINGDLIETFTGLNHINSWKNIDKKYGYGVQATVKTIDILSEFISSIVNVDEVIIIAGNHDRVTSNAKEDVSGEVVEWVHFVLNGRFGKQFPVSWTKDVASIHREGCGFVFTHGHLSISKKNPDHIVNQYGFPSMFNLVVLGHLHTRKVLSDNVQNRTIHAPSIFTGNNFSKNLGYSSLSGYLYITVKNKLPVVVDVPIT